MAGVSGPADPARAAVAPPPETRPPKVRTRPASSLFEPSILRRAVRAAFVKLDPRTMIRVPVMFVVEIGSVITAVQFYAQPSLFVGLITAWLWATVLFANFAEAVAEGRGKAQADTLRRSRQETSALLLRADGDVKDIPSTQLKVGDLCVVTAGQVIPGDGDVAEGLATVDESAITGESAPVIRESGGDRSAVTGGTTVLSDRIVVRITSRPGETFLDRMIALVEGASRQKTPNEVALDILIAGLTMILLVAVVTLQPMAIYSSAIQSTAVLVALFVCLAPTTIGGLLSAIGIAGMDRMVQRNVLAMSGRAVEAAGDCSTLLLDKTGTITYGNRMAAEFLPVGGVAETELAGAALLSSLADETPEGRSIVEFAEAHYGLADPDLAGAELIPFSAQTRMSGVDLDGRQVRKGAGGAGAFAGILLGETSPGGDGGGLYSILVFSLLAVFVAGLMVGRTPEFLGKKIRAPQMKLVIAYALTIPIVVLVFGSVSPVLGAGTRSILNPGMHGLTEVMYAFASVANNNGSAFAGLAASTPWYDTTLGLVMLIGRFVPIVLALAIAG